MNWKKSSTKQNSIILRNSFRFIVSSTLAASVCSQLAALEYELDAPSIEHKDNVLYCPSGLRMHINDKQFAYGDVEIIADTMRFNEKDQIVFIHGDVQVLNKQYRLSADSLGYDLLEERGEAQNVTLVVHAESRKHIFYCERIEINPKRLVLHKVRVDNGHGSLFSIAASRILIRRANEPHQHRSGVTANVDDITINHPRLQMGSVPFFWLPALYRDFRLDYPWTHVELGHESDRGAYARLWLGFDLPRLGDMSSMIRFRNDHYELSGKGYGVEADWSSKTIGSGSFYWFQMDPEKWVANSTGGFPDIDDLALNNLYDKMDADVLARRKAKAWEFEHTMSFSGGAVYARWSEIPNSITGTLDEDKFRADYHEDVMQEKPLARQGISSAWNNEWYYVGYDRAAQAYDESQFADREHAIQMGINPQWLFSDIHAQADIQLEQFNIDDASITGTPHSETWRINSSAHLLSSRWFRTWGYDAQIGVEALNYEDTTIQDVSLNDSNAHMLSLSAAVKTRIKGRFDNGLTHIFQPKIGLLINTEAEGDATPSFDIGDDKEQLEDDIQFIILDFENTLKKNGLHLFMSNLIRFGTRDKDRRYIDKNDIERTGPDALVDIDNRIQAQFGDEFKIDAEFLYDGLQRDWTAVDVDSYWKMHERISFNWNISLIPETANTIEQWQHKPELSIEANRYAISISTTHREHGHAIDGFSIHLKRDMIDGEMTIGYELERDDTGERIDDRISFSFAIGKWGGL